ARLRSFTPSTSKSSEPSSFIVYITGTTCGQPVGPTVANRAILCDRKNSSSASLNTTHILDSTIYMARTAADNVDTIGSYTITRREPLERLEGAYLELEHQTTGARHVHIECPDDNNGFAVFFPTPPSDSTGVAHILEHVVLAGSQRFPVRDPFFSMTRRSLSTFMNALTGSDWTMYLYSTRNAKDFMNLLQVYLDATFFPRLSEPGHPPKSGTGLRGLPVPRGAWRGRWQESAGAPRMGDGPERRPVPRPCHEGAVRGTSVQRRLTAAQGVDRFGPGQRAG